MDVNENIGHDFQTQLTTSYRFKRFDVRNQYAGVRRHMRRKLRN